LDQGPMRDWFNSKAIVVGTIIAVFGSAVFFIRGWNKPDNIIDLSLLKDRNFVMGTLAITAYGISLFGWMALCRRSAKSCSAIRRRPPERCSFPARSSARALLTSPAAFSFASSTRVILWLQDSS